MTFPFIHPLRSTVTEKVLLPVLIGSTAFTLTLLPAQIAVSQQTIGSRFSPNPLVLKGTGGGNTPIAQLVDRTNTETGPCTGFATTKPTQTLVINSFFKKLSLQIESAEDTSLAIKGPGGVWCNDDHDGNNPRISGQWLPGTYSIWVGSFSQHRAPAYILRVQESR